MIRAGLNMPDEVIYVCVNQSLQSLEGYLFPSIFKMELKLVSIVVTLSGM